MIYIQAFALTGTADFSSIKTELQNLERTIGNLRVPQIKTDVATPNFSNFFSAIDKAEKQATIKIKPEIDKSFGGGLSSFLNSEKGKFNNVGKELGQNLTMGMQQQFGMAGGMASSLAQALGPVGIAATVAGAGVIALGAASVNAARGWETLMAGVSKTTGAEGAALTQLSNTLLNLSREMPIAQAEIAKIATVGGTLGVKQSDLPKFVKDTAMASAGWGMSGEEAANSIAGISNAFKVPIADAQKFGSVINTMADNVGGSEKELADFLVRASGIATTFNEGIASTTAFGAVLASINMPMEVAATGLQSMMAYAMAPSSPERLEQWAGMMNVTVDQLKAKLEQDLYGTLIESSNAIATVGTETEQQQARIAIWGEGGARVSSGLVGMQNKYTEALKSANEQLKTGSSLAQAFGAQGATVDAKWQKFTNTMTTALIHLGTAALPVLGQVLDTMSGLIAKADEFAATTLPSWAQGATDWVNETLGMTEDTPEQIAERKAKIARTAEKTATKVADTTGYQSYAEAQASAANLGQGTGNSYVDGLNAALDTGVPKALTDAYLGDALKTGKTAAASAGKQTAEEFVKTQDEYIKSHSSGGYDLQTMEQMANQQKKQYSTQNAVIDAVTFPNEYNIRNIRDKGRDFGTLQAEDAAGNVLSSKVYHLQRSAQVSVEFQFKNVKKSLMAEIRPAIFDMPKYLRQAGSEISDSLTDILSDGVVSFEEKNELGEYIESLKSMKVDFPVEFDQANLDDQLTKLQATKLGINVDLLLGTDKLESDFYKWAEENANVIATYLANNTSYMEATQGRPEYKWLELNPDAVDLMKEYNAALSSHEPSQVSQLPGLQKDLLRLHPELQDQAFWTTKVNVAQAELNEHFAILGNTVVGIDKDGKAVSEGFQAELPVLAAHGTGLIADAEAVASHTRSVLSSIAAMSNVHYGTLPTSANYALPGTTARAYNAYKPNTPIYAPLESLNLTKFAKGGISLTKGIAEVDANELHIPKDQLPCAVSSMYDVLENPNLYFPSGLGTITDSSGATYPTQEKLESLGKVIDTTKIYFESANSGILKLSSGATYVSDRWMDEYNRFTITPPGTGYQSSDNRGYVPVAISKAAKENIIYNPFNDNESNWSAAGMDAKIFAMQQQYAGKSSVMPSSPHEEPSWIVDAAKSISGKEVISRYSAGTLNQMAVEYDTLKAANTATARYADVTDKNFYAQLMLLDATTQLTAESNEYCDGTGEMRIALEQEQMASEKATLYRKSLVGVQSKYYAAANAYLNEGKSFSEVESMLPGGVSSNDRIVDAIDQTTENVSDVKKAIDESANEYGKYGRKLDALVDGIFATTGSLRSKAGSDLWAEGQTNATKYATWRLSEFDTYLSSAESGLSSCFDYMTDWAKYQESVLAMPVEQGGQGFFKQESLGGFEKQFPSWGPWATAAQAAGIEGPWQTKTDENSVATLTADGVTRGMDQAQLNQYLSKATDYAKSTEKNTGQVVGEVKDLNGNLLAVQYSNGQIMSDLMASAVGGTGGWGGTSIGGGGGWIGTSGVYNGMNGGVYYGSTVGGWGAQASAAASSGQSSTFGSVQWAEGGITDHPVFGVFGEAGREAFVPISDRSAGLRILPRVMRELGVRTFATGGFAGSGGLIESIGGTTIAPVYNINGSGLSSSQLATVLEKHDKKLLEQVAKKTVLSARRRG